MDIMLMVNKQPIPGQHFEIDFGMPINEDMQSIPNAVVLAINYPIDSWEADFHLLDIEVGISGAEPNTRVEQSFVAVSCEIIGNKTVLRLFSSGASRTEHIQ